MAETIPYIRRGGEVIEEVGDIRLKISSTKHENSFRIINSEKYCKFFKEVLPTDIFLKILLFLKKEVKVPYPKPKVEFNFFINPDEKFLKQIKKIKEYKDEIERITEKIKEYNNSLTDVSYNNFLVILRLLFKDNKIISLLKTGRDIKKKFRDIKKKLNEVLENALNSKKEALKEKLVNLIGLILKFEALSCYQDLMKAYDHLEDAINNFESLRKVYAEFENNPEPFYQSIQRLAGNNLCEVKTKSICLECHLKSRKDPSVFTEEKNYVTRISFPESCSNCSGKTIFNTLKLEVEPFLADLIRTNRLNEVVVGYLLSQVNGVKKIYIHKNVQRLSDKGASHSCEVDVLALTEDNKIIIGEVTTMRDLDHVMEEIDKKIALLHNNNVPFDLMIFFTASMLKDYISKPDRKKYVFGINHIPKTKELVEYLIQSIKQH